MLLFELEDIFNGIGDFFSTGFMQVVLDILTFIPKVVYFIISCFLSLIDLFQVIFRKLAGLDVVMISGKVIKGDPVYTIISDALFGGKYPAISTTFWSLIILGIIMTFATTFIAVIRVEIVPDKEKKNNSKEGIIRNFFVALFNLAIVPITCIFGLYLGNAMVGVIDSAISANETYDEELLSKFDKWDWGDYEGSDDQLRESYDKDYSSYIAFDIFGYHVPTTMEPFSATIFKACAAPCNRLNKYGEGYLDALIRVNALGLFDESMTEASVAADLIDTGFMYSAKLKTPNQTLNYDGMEEYGGDDWLFVWLFGSKDNIDCFSRYNVTMVWYFYDLWTFNYIVAFAALAMMVKMYWHFALALMARLFEITGLFLIAPIPVAITPLDGGGTLQRWRARFYSKFCLMVIMVLGLNLINPLISLVHNLKLFNVAFLDYIVLAFFIVAALNAMDSLNQTISYILFDRFGEGEYKEAKERATAIQGTFNTGLTMAGKTAGIVTSAPFKVASTGAALGRNVKYSLWERDQVKKDMKFDAAKQKHDFTSMSVDDRRNWAKQYMDTTEGKALLQNFAGADDATKMRNMEEAIATNNFRGRISGTSTMTANQMRDQMYQHRHNENLFQHSDMSKGLTAGTAEYNAAMDKFNSMKDWQKRGHIVKGDQALTSAQANIRYKRENPPVQTFFKNVGRGISRVTAPIDKHIGQPVKQTFGGMLQTVFGGAFGLSGKKKDGK